MNQICVILKGAVLGAGFFLGSLSAAEPTDFTSEEMYLALADSAYSALTLEHWAKAEELLKKALRLQPANSGNTLLFSNLGVAQMQQGKMGEAIISFDVALTRAPRSSTILSHRCRAWLALDSVAKAVEDLNAVLDINPKDEWALQTRGMIHLQNYEEELAEVDFKALQECTPDNPWGYFGVAAVEEGRGNMAKAERLYRLALEKAGSGAGPTGGEQIGFRLAILYCREEKLDEAAALLRQELTRYPRSGELYAAMSLLHRLRFQNEEAEADLKLACQYGADPLLIEWISNNARK